MDRKFLFVDGIQTGKTARQRIRRHVMNGKNAGKKVHRRSRLDLLRPTPYYQKQSTSQQCETEIVDKEITVTSKEQSLACPLMNHRSLGNSFRTLSYPVETTSYTIAVFNQFFSHVVNRFYPCRLGISPDDAKYWWLRFVLSDKAAYHVIIAVAEACNHYLSGGGESTSQALYHRSRTLALVAQRLAGKDALSDSTLGVIVMMIVQEQMRKVVFEAHIHYEGLRRMIEARGGLDQLEQSPTLLLKICKMDNLYAWQYGRPMAFFRDRMPQARAMLEAEGFSFDRTKAESAIHHYDLNPYLHEILLDVTNVSILFNEIPPNTRLNYLTFAEVVHSICYRLHRFQPLHETSSLSNLEKVYHIGLTLFMITLFMQFDQHRLLKCDAVFSRLRSILYRDLDEIDNNLALWILFIGGIWITDGPDDSWLHWMIKKMTISMDIDTWPEICSVISAFPWIHNLHDKPGITLWESVCEGCRVW
ncbi:hypothetical protein EYB25_009616 [Talaromyces marneffei]|nr:hypothetical protein EYB25_009616 [Talaromyces marneffei]